MFETETERLTAVVRVRDRKIDNLGPSPSREKDWQPWSESETERLTTVVRVRAERKIDNRGPSRVRAETARVGSGPSLVVRAVVRDRKIDSRVRAETETERLTTVVRVRVRPWPESETQRLTAVVRVRVRPWPTPETERQRLTAGDSDDDQSDGDQIPMATVLSRLQDSATPRRSVPPPREAALRCPLYFSSRSPPRAGA